ncbi:hypothetical protein [Rubrobacter indicoceani]|uniref:hypothetical protein n=1 Tax=Rubrobacter indicoceani TaxID=2051957 RepID=UPI0013C44B5A|nr:hypothetical protein [Rubrobacter indicoceani]
MDLTSAGGLGPVDLWEFFDAPHIAAVGNPRVFAGFVRSASTGEVAFSSMFGTIVARAHGPGGGKVTFNAVRSYLDPEDYDHLLLAFREARKRGKVRETARAEQKLQRSI